MFHWRYTSTGEVTEDIIRPVVSVSLEIYLCWWSQRGYHPPSSQCFTGDILLLAESRGCHPPLVESSRIRPVCSVSTEIYLCWWSHRGYHPPSSQCFTGDIPLLVESPRISSAQYSVFHWRYTSAGEVTEDIILRWWSHRGSAQ